LQNYKRLRHDGKRNHRSRSFQRVLIIKVQRLIRSAIGVALKSLSAAGAPSMRTLQRSFDLAIFSLILGPPEYRGKAVKKIQDIVEFASRDEQLGDEAADN